MKKQLKRRTIGLLLENIVGRGGYPANVWSGVIDAAREHGANLVCFAGGTLENQSENVQNIVYDLPSANNVDGLIISGTLGSFITQGEFARFIEHFKGLPIVSTVISLPHIPSVLVNNEKGMRELMLHLIKHHGYRKVGFICGPENNPDAEQRYKVYRDVLSEQDIPFDPNLVVSGDFMLSSGAMALNRLLGEQKAMPDVLVASNDNMALGALEALRDWGINVPRDLAVTGFDDMRGTTDVMPPLTTVNYPAYKQGQQAVEMLLELISGEKVFTQETLSTKLKLRESCGCPDPTIERAKVGLKTRPASNFKMDFSTGRQKILAEAREKIVYLTGNVGAARMEQLVDAFWGELQSIPTEPFLTILDDILRLVAMNDGNVSHWHLIISSMRRNILPLISDDQILFRAEDMWQQARIMIGKRSRSIEGYKRLQAEQRIGKLNELTQELDTTSDLTELMNILTKGLKNLGILGCYLSLYENPGRLESPCRPILTYKSTIDSSLLNNAQEVFPPDQLVPQGILSKDEPYSLIVEPLYHRENSLGVIVFEFDVDAFEGEVYETLRSQISSALWRAHLDGYLRSLSEASTYVMKLHEPDDILQEAVNQACKTVGAFSANIVLVNRSRELWRLIVGGEHDRSVKASKIMRDIVLDTIERKEPSLISHMPNNDNAQIREIAKMGFGAVGCFPLFLRGKLIGAMCIFYEKPHYFPTAEVNALKLYVNQTAIAYDNAKRMKDMEHLQQASQKLASVEDVRSVLQQIAESAHEVLEADSVAIWSYDASQKTFLPDELVTQGISNTLIERSKLDKPSPGGTAEMVMREGYLAVSDVDDPKYDYLGPQAHRLRAAIGVRSFQGIALQVGDEVLGVLYVNYKVIQGFDNEEETTSKVFAHHAALALKKARLLKRLRRISETARVVAKVSAQEDLHSTLTEIVNGTLGAFRCDAVTLNSYNPVTEELVYPPLMAGVKHPERVQRYTRGDTNSILYQMLERDEPCIVEEITKNDDFNHRRFVKDEGIKSCVAIPLDVANQKVGVMFVNYRTQHHFTGQEIEDIQLFANQAAVAIHNAQLHDLTIKKAQHLQSLYEAGKAVTGTLASDEILKRIVEQASLLTEYQGQQPIFCNLALKENNLLTFKVSYSANHISSLVETGYVIDLEQTKPIGIVGRAVNSGRSQLVPDVSKDPDYINGNHATKSFLAVPIIIGKEIVGVIGIGHANHDAFDEEDRACLELLSTQAGLAIRNAQLYGQVNIKALYLQELYEAGKTVTSTLALDEILQHIVEHASSLTAYKGQQPIFCYLALKEKNKLKFKASYSASRVSNSNVGEQVYIIDLEHDNPIGIVGRAVRTGKSQLVLDVTKDPDYIPFDKKTRSLLAVPIIVEKSVVGVIVVEHSSYNAFDEEDRDCLESLSTQAGLAIRNAWLYEKVTTRANYLQALYGAGKTVTSTLALDEILKHIVEQASLLTVHDGEQAHFCHLALHHENTLRFKAVYPPDHKSQLTKDGYKINLEKDKLIGIVGRAVKTGKSQLVLDVSRDPDYIIGNSKTRSELAVPIILGEAVVGVIGVEHSSYDAFDEDDLGFLESLSTQAASAIQNAQLYDEATRESRHLQALYKAGAAVTSTLSLNEILERIVDEVRWITGSNGQPAYLVHLGLMEVAILKIKVWRSDGSEGPQDVMSIDLEHDERIGIMGQAAKQGKSILREDVTRDQDYLTYDTKTLSELAVPIKLGQKVIGIINVEHPDYAVFDQVDQQSLEALATYVAIAIKNAQDYENLKSAQGLIAGRTALAWMGMASSVWSHSANKHALTIRETAQLLRRDGERNGWLWQDSRAGERIREIEILATEILDKAITLPLSSESGLKKVSINALIGERTKRLWQNAPYKNVNLTLTLELPDSAIVQANPDWLQRAFDMLVDNAVKAIGNRKVREIEIGTRTTANAAEIIIADSGPGMPKEIIEKLGLRRIEKPADAEGLGMGLLIAQTVVQTYGGNIRVDESAGRTGTMMIMSLPLKDEQGGI